jgi:hypothetical protein
MRRPLNMACVSGARGRASSLVSLMSALLFAVCAFAQDVPQEPSKDPANEQPNEEPHQPAAQPQDGPGVDAPPSATDGQTPMPPQQPEPEPALGPKSPAQYVEGLLGAVREFTLSNGMRVLVLERHSSPTLSAKIFFRVGAANEPAGQSGITHFVERLMFKGTDVIGTRDFKAEEPLIGRMETLGARLDAELAAGNRAHKSRLERYRQELAYVGSRLERYAIKDDFVRIYSGHGAQDLGSFTTCDFTAFGCSLPANKLELWMLMESGRMLNPVFRDFYPERDRLIAECGESAWRVTPWPLALRPCARRRSGCIPTATPCVATRRDWPPSRRRGCANTGKLTTGRRTPSP